MVKVEHTTLVNAVSRDVSRGRRWKAPTALGVAAVVVAGAGWFGLAKSGVLGSGGGGMPGLDTWGGTFAVIDKESDIDMNSESAGLDRKSVV